MAEVLYFAALVLPGFVLILAGAVLRLGRNAERPSRRRMAGRLIYAGKGLAFLVPGIALLIVFLAGRMEWPGLLGVAVFLLFGGGTLYGLRLHWDDPWREPQR